MKCFNQSNKSKVRGDNKNGICKWERGKKREGLPGALAVTTQVSTFNLSNLAYKQMVVQILPPPIYKTLHPHLKQNLINIGCSNNLKLCNSMLSLFWLFPLKFHIIFVFGFMDAFFFQTWKTKQTEEARKKLEKKGQTDIGL